MGPLRVVYNVTSNIPNYHDESPSGSNHSREASDAVYGANSSTIRVDEEALARAETRYSWSGPILRRLPLPLRRACVATARWARGPTPPRPWAITPFFPRWQMAPVRFVDRWLPKPRHKIAALGFFYFCWLLVFITVFNHSAFESNIQGYGSPYLLSCVDSYWLANNGCGTDGENCRPFSNSSLAFRCPASCLSTHVLNPYAVGTYEANYQPLVIGGPRNTSDSVRSAIYRGDSFICSAAIHAGFITNAKGGCGVLSLVGQKSDFPSVDQNSIKSIPFNTYFPLSYKFLADTSSPCVDLRWPLTAAAVVFSVLLSLFVTSPGVFFWTLFCALFFHVALVTDQTTVNDYYTLISICFGAFLPAAFCAYAIYVFAVRRTLTGLRAQVEKTILWVGGCWVGCLNNYTFDRLPLQRLTPHDLQQQPGAITVLVVIVLVLTCIAVGQAWAIRIEGRLPMYLALYGFMVFCLLMLLAVPNETLRIHHYILALLLLPGTALQTRPSLLYQGLLVGLFINGIARWGFASILQTPGQLLAGGIIGSALPKIHTPAVSGNNITFSWAPLPPGYDGLSILVNDVERYRGYTDSGLENYTWTRLVAGEPEYFRFGYMNGSLTQDYTQAGTWHVDGSWTKMKPGPSRLKT